MFSIIIPTKNSEKKILPCLNSIASQKNKIKKEVIFIDGNSSDDTINIVKKFEKKNKKNIKFKYLINLNSAESATAEGIHCATGKYIAFLGSDDRLYNENTLTDVKNIFHKEKCDILYGSYELINSNEKKIKEIIVENLDYKKILNKKNYVCATSLYFKRSIFNKIEKNIDDGYDFAFILKTFNKFKVIKTNKILSKFQLHEMSNSGNFYKNIVNIKKDWEISRKYGGNLFNNYHLRYIVISILKFTKLLWLAEIKRKKTWTKLLNKKVDFKKNNKEIIDRLKQNLQ
jgi:glycosyltransferase involved in cell wall biosynthesis